MRARATRVKDALLDGIHALEYGPWRVVVLADVSQDRAAVEAMPLMLKPALHQEGRQLYLESTIYASRPQVAKRIAERAWARAGVNATAVEARRPQR